MKHNRFSSKSVGKKKTFSDRKKKKNKASIKKKNKASIKKKKIKKAMGRKIIYREGYSNRDERHFYIRLFNVVDKTVSITYKDGMKEDGIIGYGDIIHHNPNWNFFIVTGLKNCGIENTDHVQIIEEERSHMGNTIWVPNIEGTLTKLSHPLYSTLTPTGKIRIQEISDSANYEDAQNKSICDINRNEVKLV